MEKVTSFFKNTADTIKGYFQSSPESQEDIDKIQAERKAYYDDIKAFQTKVSDDLKLDKISPETGVELNALIKSSQEWLTNNPNATYLEVNNKHVNFPKLYEPIYEREVPQNQLLILIYALQAIFDEVSSRLEDSGSTLAGLSSSQKSDWTTMVNSVKSVLDNEIKWYQNNTGKDGIIYTQEIDTLITKIVNITTILDTKMNWSGGDTFTSYVKLNGDSVKKNKNPMPWLMKDQVEKNKITRKALAAQQYSNTKLVAESTSIALSIFGSFILTAIIIYGASLAANMAIGREIHYRIFYFIFAWNPVITPIIFAYTALMALKGHPIPYYGILPISTEPATTRLGKILWYPFLYMSYQYVIKSKADFVSYLTAVGDAVMSMPKPDAIQL